MKDLARFTYFNAKMTTDISTYKFVVLPGWMVQPLWLAITHGDPEFKILHTARSRSKTEIFNQWKFTFKCTTCIIKFRARRIPTITHINDIYNGDNSIPTWKHVAVFQMWWDLIHAVESYVEIIVLSTWRQPWMSYDYIKQLSMSGLLIL